MLTGMGQRTIQSRRFVRYPAFVATVLLVLLVAYWAHLFATYDAMRSQIRQDTLRLASQTAHALSLQVNTLFRKLDYFSIQLADAWLSDTPEVFDRSVQTAMRTLPDDALVQVAVTDAQGVVVYSHLGDGKVQLDSLRPVSIADRTHFQVHRDSKESAFFISEPVLGRISKAWTVQFTRGLWKDGVFEGVLVLAVSASHLSAALERTFPDADDVAVVVRSDGAYLARSRDLDGVFGTKLPSDRPFLLEPQAREGAYEVVAQVDGVRRLYAWWRGENYPFVLAVGYGTEKSLSVTEQAITESIEQNAVSSAGLFLAVGVLLWMWIQRSRQTAHLKETQLRLKLALSGGSLAAWDWQIPTDELKIDHAWANMRALDKGDIFRFTSDWMQRIHPDDRRRVDESLQTSLGDPSGLFECEYRVIDDDGSPVWISDRGEIVERDLQGHPVRMSGVKQDITQRKEAQQAEEAMRQQLVKLVAEIPGAVIQFKRDVDGHFSFPFASPAIQQIYGTTSDQLIESADNVFQLIDCRDVARVRESIEVSANTLQEWRAEYRVVHPDGEIRWISGRSKPERLDDGSVLWHGYLQDVTTDREMAETLKASEAHLRLTLQAVHDGLWSYDHQSETASWDTRIRELLGYTDVRWESPTLSDLLSIIHPEDAERLARETVESFSGGGHDVIWMDFRLKTSDQRWRWVQARGRVVEWNDDGSARRTVGILTDISTQVAEVHLRQALLNRSPAAIVLMGPAREFIEANEQFKALFLKPGMSISELDVRTLHVDQAHDEKMRLAYQQLRSAAMVRLDFPLLDVHGSVHWFDMHGVPQDPADPLSPVVWTMMDITARHAADQALRAERLRLTALLTRFPGGVLIEDSQQCIVFVNDRWCQLMDLNIPPQSLIGISHSGLEDLIGTERALWHQESLQVVKQGDSGSIEVEDGEHTFLELEHLEIVQASEYLGTVWFVWDITERKHKEHQLSQLASTDPLTGLANRRSFLQGLNRHLKAVAVQHVISRGVVLMLDIDHFKAVNDTYGHAIGDQVLKYLATTIKGQVREREGDLAGRLGGEEFAVLLTAVDEHEGMRIAERIRQAVEASQVVTSNAIVRIKVSIGLAVVGDNETDDILKHADKALYKAKRTGRNRTCVWDSDL